MSTKQIAALKLALECIERGGGIKEGNTVYLHDRELMRIARDVIREALADRELMQQALEALERSDDFDETDAVLAAIKALRKRLVQPKQEPVAFPRQADDSTWTVDTAFILRVKHTIDPDTPHDFTPSEEQIETVLLALEKIPSSLYITPPAGARTEDGCSAASKPWVGLTDEEIDECYYWKDRQWTTDELVRYVEAKLREKNA